MGRQIYWMGFVIRWRKGVPRSKTYHASRKSGHPPVEPAPAAAPSTVLSPPPPLAGVSPLWHLISVALILATVLLTACGDEIIRFTLEGTDKLVFKPDTITVSPGQTVELTLVNRGTLDHTFTVPELNIEVQLPAGETDHVTFTAPKSGEYRFMSGVLRDLDTMKGKIIVR
jgi:plastocyanin